MRAQGAARGVSVVPLLGARTQAQLSDALAGLEVTLSPADLAAIEAAVPADAVAGTRYPEMVMASLDSEQR